MLRSSDFIRIIFWGGPMDLDRLNYNANQSKLGNLFLGFFEGLFLDGRVRIQEI